MSQSEPRPVRSDADLLDVIERRARRIWWVRRLGTASIVVLVLAAAAVPVMADRGEQAVTVASGEPEPTPTSQAIPTTTSEPPPETTTTEPALQPAAEPDPPPPEVEVVTPTTTPTAGGPAAGGDSTNSPTEPYDWPHCPSDESTQAPPDGMVVELMSDEAAYAVGEPITFTVSARNEGTEEVTNHHPGDGGDIIVERDSRTIWRLQWEGLVGHSETFVFEPGDERTAEDVWDQRMCDPDTYEEEGRRAFLDDPLPAGIYTARAYWGDMSGGWDSNTITFEVG